MSSARILNGTLWVKPIYEWKGLNIDYLFYLQNIFLQTLGKEWCHKDINRNCN